MLSGKTVCLQYNEVIQKVGEVVAQIIYGLTHLEAVLLPLFEYFGTSSYFILFAIIFMETGLVIFPFCQVNRLFSLAVP